MDRDGAADGLERRRLTLFLLFAFGIAWATAAVLHLNGGLTDSPTALSVGGFSLSLADVLLPTTYMFAPGVANLLTRWLTGEGRDDHMLSFGLADNWRAYLLAWFVPGLLAVLGAALFLLLFPQYADLTGEAYAAAVVEASPGVSDPADLGMSPFALALVTVGAAFALNPLVNAVFGFGEEFGWRGYLLPKLVALGARRAVLLQGLVWGVWHWPLIAMGYEYGFGYPGAPWSGFLLFLPFTVGVGTFLAWLTLRTDSVWPASLGHGAVNATAVVAVVFARGDPNPLLGPLPVGAVGMVPWLLVAAYLLYRLGEGDTVTTAPAAARRAEE